MRISADNINAQVSDADDTVMESLRDELTIWPSRWTPNAEPVRLLQSRMFPTGLIPRVWKWAKANGVEVSIEDRRSKPCEVDPHADLKWLRSYQVDAVNAVIKRKRGVLQVPTGGGKTEIAIGITRVLPCRWLFVAHRANLTEQAKDRFILRAGEAGVDVGTFDNPGDAALTIVTFQTLWSRLKRDYRCTSIKLAAFKGLIVDECHTLPATTFYTAAQACDQAYYRVGLSGTPARGSKDDIFTEAALGAIVYKLTAARLVSEGRLSVPTIRLIRCHQEGNFGRWRTAYKTLVVQSKVRNRLVVEAAKASKKPCLIFVNECEHGKALQKLIQREGFSVEYADGSWGVTARQRVATKLNRHELDVLITTKIFQEGVDIPYLMSVINAAGGQSIVQALQQAGRAMRAAKGKSACEIWDFDDYGQKWLRRHALSRAKHYESQGFKPELWSPQMDLQSKG